MLRHGTAFDIRESQLWWYSGESYPNSRSLKKRVVSVTLPAHLMFFFNTPLKLNSEFAPEKVTKTQ